MDLGNILESMGFAAGRYPETWQATTDGIQLNVALHPWKGIAINFCHLGGRTVSQGEVFLPRTATKQEIAQAIVQIHERIHGK